MDNIKQLNHFKKVLKQQEDGDCPFCGKRTDLTRGYSICDNPDCKEYTKIIAGNAYFVAMRQEVEKDDIDEIIKNALNVRKIYEGTLSDEKIEYNNNGGIDGTILSIKVNEVAWGDHLGKKVAIIIE